MKERHGAISSLLFVASSIHPMIYELASDLAKRHVRVCPVILQYRNWKMVGIVIQAFSFLIRLIVHDFFSVRKLLVPRAMSLRSLLYYFYFFGIANMIVGLDQEFKFDIIHAFWSYPAGIASFMAKIFIRKPLVISVLGYDVDKRTLENPMLREVSRLTLEGADAVITGVGNHYLVTSVLGIEEEKVHLLPAPVNTARFSPEVNSVLVRKRYGIRDEDSIVAFGPHLREVYDPGSFLRAAAIVQHRMPNVTFMLLGAGNLRPKLEEMARRLGVRAVFTGKVPYSEMPFYYAAVVVYCMPCYAGVGISALEAMASGKPVIGYKRKIGWVGTGATDIVDGVDSFLVRPGDVKELAEKMLFLLENPSVSREMGLNARKRIASQHNLSLYVEEHLRIYDIVVRAFGLSRA